MESRQILNKTYLPFIIQWGKRLNIMCFFFLFIPQIYLGIVHGMWPQFAPVLQGWLAIAGVVGVAWFMQPLQFFPVLGVAGTYMSNISGNIQNMLVPCAIASCQSAGVEPGSPESEICANIAVAVSTVINLAILTVGLIFAVGLLALLPAGVNTSLGFLLPALQGACMIMVGWRMIKVVPIALAVSLFTRMVLIPVLNPLLPFNLAPFLIIIVVFGTIAINLLLYSKKIYFK